MTKPLEIELPERLRYLVKYCEKACVAECCGIDAFDFSPLHIASYISAYTRRIDENEIAAWEAEIHKAEEMVIGLPANDDGYVCSVADMNQYFRAAEFERFMAELRHSMRAAPRLLELSIELEFPRSETLTFRPQDANEERAEPSASPNSAPSTRLGNSGVTEGPPSVN